jgi:hypothetical protein
VLPPLPLPGADLNDEELVGRDSPFPPDVAPVELRGIEDVEIDAGVDHPHLVRTELARRDDHLLDVLADRDDGAQPDVELRPVERVEREGDAAVDDDRGTPPPEERRGQGDGMRDALVDVDDVDGTLAVDARELRRRRHVEFVPHRKRDEIDAGGGAPFADLSVAARDDGHPVSAPVQVLRELEHLHDRARVEVPLLEHLQDRQRGHAALPKNSRTFSATKSRSASASS